MSLDFKDFLKRQKCFCLRLCFPVCYITLSVKLGTTSLDTWLAKSIDVLRTTSVAFPARHLYSALRHCGYGARYHVATWCDAASPTPRMRNASRPPRSVREASRAGRAGHQRAVPPSLPSSARDIPLQPRAARRLASHPGQTHPASPRRTSCQAWAGEGDAGDSSPLQPEGKTQKKTEEMRYKKIIWLEDLSLFTLSKRWPSPTSTQKRHFWGQVAFKIKVKSITRHRGPETK